MRQIKTSDYRKLSMYGFSMVEGGHNIFALLEFDITNLRAALRKKRIEGEGGSLFAFLLKAIGKCLESYPLFNALIDSRKTTIFDEVDINIPIEVESDGEIFNKQYIIRNINKKTIAEISREIEIAKKSVDEQKGFVLSKRLRRILCMLPGRLVVALMRSLLRDHKKVKELSGTIFVTSVSMFSNVPGYIIPYSGGPRASSIAIGSSIKKPVVKGDAIVIREIINLTVTFNHDIIDGAPAARFINQLRKCIETDFASLI